MQRKESTYDRTEVMTSKKVRLTPFLRERHGVRPAPELSVNRGERIEFNAALAERMDLSDAHSVLFARRSDNGDFVIIVERDAVGAKGVKLAKKNKSGGIVNNFRNLAQALIDHYGDQGGKVQRYTVDFDPEIGAWALTPKEGGEG